MATAKRKVRATVERCKHGKPIPHAHAGGTCLLPSASTKRKVGPAGGPYTRFQKATVHSLQPKHLLTATVMFTVAKMPDGEFECFLSPLQVSGNSGRSGAIDARRTTAQDAVAAVIAEFLNQRGVV